MEFDEKSENIEDNFKDNVDDNIDDNIKDNNEQSFEENLLELENIVRKLENGDVPLDNAIDEFHKAMILVKSCDKKLNNAKESIAQLVKDNDDVIKFNIEE